MRGAFGSGLIVISRSRNKGSIFTQKPGMILTFEESECLLRAMDLCRWIGVLALLVHCFAGMESARAQADRWDGDLEDSCYTRG